MSSNIVLNKKCDYCGKEFPAKTLYTRYCSHTCNSTHYKLLKRQEKINNFKEDQSKPVENLIPFDAVIQQKDFLNVEETAALLGASWRFSANWAGNSAAKWSTLSALNWSVHSAANCAV